MKKKLLIFLTVLICAVISLGALTSCAERETILKVYNWAEYVGDNVIADFEEYYESITGKPIHVNYTTFDINETMLAKVATGADYDVVCPSDYAIEKLIRYNKLTPLKENLGLTVDGKPIEDYRGMQSKLVTSRSEYDPEQKFSRTYTWGTMGILYNKDMLAPEHQADNDGSGHPDWLETVGWGALWAKNIDGTPNGWYTDSRNTDYGILMKDSYRDSYAIAALYTFRDDLLNGTRTQSDVLNTTNKADIAKIEANLIAQKDLLKGYEVDSGKQEAADGKVSMTLQWGGDAVWAIADAAENGITLDYFIPPEGSNIFFDGWCIPSTSRNPDAAQLFINFMCRPDISIRNMDYIGYSSPCNTEEFVEYMAETFPDEKARAIKYFMGSDELIYAPLSMYPLEETIARCGVMRDFGEHEEDIIKMWINVKIA